MELHVTSKLAHELAALLDKVLNIAPICMLSLAPRPSHVCLFFFPTLHAKRIKNMGRPGYEAAHADTTVPANCVCLCYSHSARTMAAQYLPIIMRVR